MADQGIKLLLPQMDTVLSGYATDNNTWFVHGLMIGQRVVAGD